MTKATKEQLKLISEKIDNLLSEIKEIHILIEFRNRKKDKNA